MGSPFLFACPCPARSSEILAALCPLVRALIVGAHQVGARLWITHRGIFHCRKGAKRVSGGVALPCLIQSKSGPQLALRFCGEHVLALEGEYDQESTTTDGVRQA